MDLTETYELRVPMSGGKLGMLTTIEERYSANRHGPCREEDNA